MKHPSLNSSLARRYAPRTLGLAARLTVQVFGGFGAAGRVRLVGEAVGLPGLPGREGPVPMPSGAAHAVVQKVIAVPRGSLLLLLMGFSPEGGGTIHVPGLTDDERCDDGCGDGDRDGKKDGGKRSFDAESWESV